MPTEPWTGRTACALQGALRLSHERFAEYLGIGVRTVASWHQNPAITPKSDIQQLLDTAYERASASARKRFSDELGEPADVDETSNPSAHADAERRLTADPHISAALEWLDTYSGGEAGTHRRRVAERLASIDVRDLRDRGTRRGGVTSTQVAHALEQYYGQATDGYGRYTASIADKHVSTTILTRPEWLDLACPLVTTFDGLVFNEQDRGASTVVDELTTDAAVTRLAETLELGTRLVNMPLYGLENIQVGADGIGGRVGVLPFVEYALTMDLLEGELLDALASGNGPPAAGELPLRDRFLPELSSVVDPSSRVCAGGALALCAIARPAGLHGEADYLILVQQRSGNVLNANRQLSVIPKGFHQPMADLRGDTRLGLTLLRETEEELFGRDDIDNTLGDQRSADPMHPSRLTDPMRWLLERPVGERIRMECTAFGFNLVSGNYEFPSLIVIEDEEFWVQYGGQVEANWEASNLRRYSTRDPELLAELISEVTWSNEGLFAFLQGLRRLSEIGGQRVKPPSIAWETR
ncbi:hypothetical protein BJF85_04910 [Saccharomonospora sp. CUA-673]|uniref:transcriptional regulator n=1 Tax=Saccharomonospora sp. CUA-673 TaxID=1904969 RepID=UPI0009694E39|nr:transcriptional regulator [Saccharomonospora sp. CUA-673]OLT41747.1 hypothetical protein BJF85_04910 [Saccharomonospora sp. CUA-673]